MKILVIDDEAIHRDLIMAALQKSAEHQVSQAADARSGWELLNDRGHWFDVLFLDVRMPGMSGIELLQQITDSPLHRSLKVIMCTAVNDRASIVQAIQKGAHHYIIKPCDETAILAKLALLKKSANSSRTSLS